MSFDLPMEEFEGYKKKRYPVGYILLAVGLVLLVYNLNKCMPFLDDQCHRYPDSEECND